MADDQHLASWNDGRQGGHPGVRGRATGEGSPDLVPPEERVAVFDNDGTLWSEKPMPIQLDFIAPAPRRLAEQVPALRDRQPLKAPTSRTTAGWAGRWSSTTEGDDGDLKVLLGGVRRPSRADRRGVRGRGHEFFADGQHPDAASPVRACGYRPMVELLRYLEANGFMNYIASGGDRDFMRPAPRGSTAFPPERVIGSSNV